MSETEESRREFQRTAKGFRTQLRDPLHPDQRLSITAPTRAELEIRKQAVREIKRSLKYGAMGPRDAARALSGSVGAMVTVDELWREYAKGSRPHLKRAVDSCWKHRLEPWFGGKRPWECDEPFMIRWLRAAQEKGYAVRSIHNAYAMLAASFNLEIRRPTRRISELPWGGWRPPAPPKDPLDAREACRSLEELVAIIHAAQEKDARKWKLGRRSDLSIRVIVIGLCGLRNGEAAGLGWDDLEIDSNPPIIHVRHQVLDGWQQRNPGWSRPVDPPKNGPHNLILHPCVVAALWVQRDDLKKHGWYRPDGPVFPGPHGAWRACHETIDPAQFRTLAKAAGLPNPERWVTHSLRHSFATLEAVASGGDLRTVQRRTGHSSIEMLEKYLHASGRGMAQSFIDPSFTIDLHRGRPPELEPPHIPPQLPEHAGEPAAPVKLPMATATLVDLVASTASKAREYEERIKSERAERRKARKKKWRRDVIAVKDLALAAVESGATDHRACRPPEITAGADKSYCRAYAAEMGRSSDTHKAQIEGRKARRAFLGAWAVEFNRAVKFKRGGGT